MNKKISKQPNCYHSRKGELYIPRALLRPLGLYWHEVLLISFTLGYTIGLFWSWGF